MRPAVPAVLLLLVASLILTLAPLTSTRAEPAPEQARETVRLVKGQWWTGRDFKPGARFVRDGRFVRPSRAARTVDMKGGYVLPPFGEAHNHNLDMPDRVRAVSDQYLAQGIFYVKNPNSRPEFTRAARAQLNRQDTVDAVFSMGGLTDEGGHPVRLYGFLSQFFGPKKDGESFEGDAFHLVRGARDIEPVLNRLQAQGADFVKTYLLHSEAYAARSKNPAFHGLRGLDPALYPAVIRAAHRRGLKVAVHVETAADFRTAVAAGVDEVAHLPGYSWEVGETAEVYRLTGADVRLAARRGVVMTTTTVVSQNYRFTPERLAEIQAVQVDNLRRLHRAGVPLAIGSDSYAATSRIEAENLLKIGALDAPTVLRLWVDTPRTAIFPSRRLSCLKVGCEADFLILKDDPLKDFSATARISGAWKAGRPLALPRP